MVRLHRGRTALLVIDVQERLLPVIDDHEELEVRIRTAVEGAAALGVPVVATEQYPKGLGPTVPSLAEHLASPVEKLSFSCCGVEGVDRALAAAGPQTVLVAGIETHVCVLQTVLDLLERGLNPVLLADCTASRHRRDHEIALERLRGEGATITTVESALFELVGVAGSDEFKQISRLVKPL
jgi:nicotinamidase-related amidase